jgi:HSP90 family molecular chaperone
MIRCRPRQAHRLWEQFGRALKEGGGSDYDNKDRIVSLLLFQSSNDPEKLTTLKDYVERMKEGQREIYYLTGESRSVVENSSHLEAVREKGYEALYLVEPVDELLIYSPQLERLLMKVKGGGPKQRRILELNPAHEIFIKLSERFNKNQEDAAIKAYAELMLGYAPIAEGSELPDPVKFNLQLVDVMLQTL